MTAMQRLYEALKPLGIPIVPDLQTGGDQTFITYENVLQTPADFGDDLPGAFVGNVQVHYCTQMGKPYTETRNKIRNALIAAGFTAPEISELNSKTQRHVIFECDAEEN